jgi:hypothetical protein
MSGDLDGVWLSDKYDIEITGNCGVLTKLSYSQQINGDIPPTGAPVVRNLMKNGSAYSGYRMYFHTDSGELRFDSATFSINKERDILLSITKESKDTIIFLLNK